MLKKARKKEGKAKLEGKYMAFKLLLIIFVIFVC